MSWKTLAAQRAYMKRWRKKNRKKTREQQAAWREANRQRLRDYNLAWRTAHPEQQKAITDRYRAKYPDKVNRIHRRYRRREKQRNKLLLLSLPCIDCGMKHTRERRQAILRRMLPTTAHEVREAWPCIWDEPWKVSSAGEGRLYRDLHEMGAVRVRGTWVLRERSAA